MRTYIIHVSTDLVREEHIKSQISDKGLDVTFITKGDKPDLTDQVLSTYFTARMKNVSSSTSCVYKHILAYEKLIENKDDFALILEDDIIFYKGFKENLEKFVKEIKKESLRNFIISLEDSMLTYIKRSERVKNKFLYPKEYGRYAGAYLIDHKAASNILSLINDNKCSTPMDWFHDDCAKKEILQIYWSQPTIAVQKSMIGSMATLIDNKTSGFFRIISFYLQKSYKRLLYYLR